MLWLPDSVNAFRKMALLRVAPRSPRTFAFYEMAPGIMWAVLFHTPTNDLHLSKLAVGQDKDEWNHLEPRAYERGGVNVYRRPPRDASGAASRPSAPRRATGLPTTATTAAPAQSSDRPRADGTWTIVTCGFVIVWYPSCPVHVSCLSLEN
jgi:hypothetical protein